MPRPRETPDPNSTAIRNEIRMRELDRANRRALDSVGDGTLGARHTWTGTTTVPPNTDVTAAAALNWTSVRDDGIATFVPVSDFDVSGFLLNRSGRWSINLFCITDAGFAGVMRAGLVQDSPDIFDEGYIRDSRLRGTGFAGAGTLHQTVTWDGPVSDAEARNPLSVVLRHSTGGTASVTATCRLQLSYLGSMTAAPAPVVPVDGVPQDDGAAA